MFSKILIGLARVAIVIRLGAPRVVYALGLHPECEENHDAFHELFTNYRTRDGNLFTGMNQNASCGRAQDILYALQSR